MPMVRAVGPEIQDEEKRIDSFMAVKLSLSTSGNFKLQTSNRRTVEPSNRRTVEPSNRRTVEPSNYLSQDRLDDFSGDVGQAEIAAAVAEGELLVIETEQV
jgi:hypothetical protein